MRRLTGLMVAIVAAILFGAAEVVTEKWSSVRHAQSQIDRVFDPAALVSRQLLSDFVDQETGERGYIITGDRSYLAPYREGLAGSRRDLARLRSLLGEDPALLADVNAVARAGAAWRTAIAPQISDRAAGNVDAADASVAAGTGKAAFDRVRSSIAELQAAVDSGRMAGERSQRSATAVLSTTLVVTAGVLSALVVALTIAAWRAIVRPLRRLSGQLHVVSAGAVHTRLAASGPAEIAALGRDAEAMRARLVDQIDTAEHASEALTQRAPVIRELRRALAPSDDTELPAGLEVQGVMVPAEGEVAGDWWDTISHPDGTVTLLLADISGHGPRSALRAVALKTVLCAGLRSGISIATLLDGPARQVFAENYDMFATAVIIDLDPAAGELRWVNAGHPAPLLVAADGDVRWLHSTAPMIHPALSGVTGDHAPFEPGATVFAYSDGVTDPGHFFGSGLDEPTLVATVRAAESATDACASALAVLDQRTGQHRQRDDVTVLAAHRRVATADVGQLVSPTHH